MRIIYGILFAIIYTIGYVFLAMLVTGGGHGNFIGMLLVNITWAVNFAALILLTQLKYKIIRIFFVLMMLAYYGRLFFILTAAAADKKMVTHPHAAQLFIPAGWFLLGQAIIWTVFFKKIKEADNRVNDPF